MPDQQSFYPEALASATAYDVYGPAHGFPLVFLHAGALTRKMWQPQIDTLAHVFRIIVLDLPGHGALAQYAFRLTTAVEEVTQIIKKEVQGQALLVGLSLGGFVALALAHERPELVSGLVLAGCSLDTQGINETLLKVRGSLLANNVALVDRLLATITERVLRSFYPDRFVAAQGSAGIYWKSAGQGLRECAGKDFRSMLHTYRGPVLVLNGENDRNSRKSEDVFLSAANQDNIRIRIVKEAGHLCNLDRPHAFNDALGDFTQTDLYHSYHYGYQGNKETGDQKSLYYVKFEEPEMGPPEDMRE